MDAERKHRDTIKKKYMQCYAQATMADKLKAQGFTSYNDENLSWYKIVNNEILQTVFIYSRWHYFPLLVTLVYGVHPLFIMPPLPHKVVELGWAGDRETESLVRYTDLRKVFSDEISVQCPATEGCGAELLDTVVFPVFAQTNTIEDAYTFFKNRYLTSDWAWVVTSDFIDMAIWMNDKDMYPHCNDTIMRLQNVSIGRYWLKSDAKRNQLQYEAIVEGKRDEYLKVLEKRKTQILRKLDKGHIKT